jgi:predicted transcriptional regulator
MKNPTEQLRSRLRALAGRYARIARESEVPYSTLVKFARGVIRQPGHDAAVAIERAVSDIEAELNG